MVTPKTHAVSFVLTAPKTHVVSISFYDTELGSGEGYSPNIGH